MTPDARAPYNRPRWRRLALLAPLLVALGIAACSADYPGRALGLRASTVESTHTERHVSDQGQRDPDFDLVNGALNFSKVCAVGVFFGLLVAMFGMWFKSAKDPFSILEVGATALVTIVGCGVSPLLSYTGKDKILEVLKRLREQEAEARRHAADAERRFRESQQALAELRGLVISLQPPSLPEGVRGILAIAEMNNPGLSITASISPSGGTTYQFERKDGDAELIYGSLSFPNDEAGQRGRSKFQEMLDRGVQRTLDSGEFIWDRSVSLPASFVDDGSATFTLTPHPPDEVHPVRMVALQDGKVVARIDLADFRVVRMGRKEIEILISGRKFAGQFTHEAQVTGEVKDGRDVFRVLSFGWKMDLSNVRAIAALQTIDLANALCKGAVLRVESLEFDAPIFEAPSFGLEAPANAVRMRNFAAALEIINRRYVQDIRIPSEMTRSVEDAALVVATGIQLREATSTFDAPSEVNVYVPVFGVRQLLGEVEAGKDLRLPFPPQEINFKICDVTITVNDVECSWYGVKLAIDTSTLRSNVEGRRDDELVQISITARGIHYAFNDSLDKAIVSRDDPKASFASDGDRQA